MIKYKSIFLVTLMLNANFAFGAQVLVRPSQAGRTTDTMIFSDQASSFGANATTGLQVRLNVSCFGTNLRSVANPVSPAGSIKFSMALRNGRIFSIVFPGWMMMSTGENAIAPVPAPLAIVDDVVSYMDPSPKAEDLMYPPPNQQPGRTTAIGNTIIFDAPANFDVGMPTGTYSSSNVASLVERVSFVQDIASVVGQVQVAKRDKEQRIKPWSIQKILGSFMTPFKWIPWNSPEKTFAGGDGGDGGGDGGGGDGGGDGGGGGGDGGGDGGSVASIPVLLEYGPLGSPDYGWGQPRFAWFSQIVGQQLTPNPANYSNKPADVQKYLGKDGDVTANWEASWSNDFRVLNVNASFPGQVSFCGGFFSPLMLFFDQKPPSFDKYVKFRMSSYSEYSYWPDPETNAAFLVLDRNGDGIINDVSEMFGNEDSSMNGFELLAAFDENGDGVIDSKDPVYSKLRLWRDSTGTGVTLKKDLKTLKEAGVESISLKYTKPAAQLIGNGAELRERSSFTMVKKGQRIKGEVIDVWLSNKR